MHQRKGQEVEDRGGVQSTVQHDGGGFELEDIARQCRVTRQTILEGEKKKYIYRHANNIVHGRYNRSRIISSRKDMQAYRNLCLLLL